MQLDVSTYEWPDRFFVEALSEDRDYVAFFGSDTGFIPPHFVDLSEWYCSCRDFNFNVLPWIDQPHARQTCSHIDAALRYRSSLTVRLATLPLLIKL